MPIKRNQDNDALDVKQALSALATTVCWHPLQAWDREDTSRIFRR